MFRKEWSERLKLPAPFSPGVSDSAHYGGTNVGNTGEVDTLKGPVPELNLTVPPLAAIFLVPES